MSDNTRKNDEIDLIELFQRIGQGIKSLFVLLFKFLEQVLYFGIRWVLLVLVLGVVGWFVGKATFTSSKAYFSTTMEAHSNAVSSIEMINYINQLNGLLRDNSLFAEQTKLQPDQIKNIKSIKGYKAIDLNRDGFTDLIDYQNEYLISDTLVDPSLFVVKVEIYTKSDYENFSEGISNYINNNNYFQQLNLIRLKQKQELLSQYNKEIKLLDSLQVVEYITDVHARKKTLDKNQLFYVVNEKETQMYYTDIFNLYEIKQNISRELILQSDLITVTKDFSSLIQSEVRQQDFSRKYMNYGIIISILFALVVEFRKAFVTIIRNAFKTFR